MRHIPFLATRYVLPLFLAMLLNLTSPPAYAGTLPPGTADFVAKLLPTVVAIEAIQENRTTGANGAPVVTRGTYTGSGFIIDPTGLIVTNHHVVEDAVELYVILSDQTRGRARLLYISPIDMVLLKIDVGRPLPAVTWGVSANMRPGDSVIAIGDPLAVGITVTAGIISALDRNINETIFDNFLQTDAAINHGNSGGPLFNLNGEVIGMNTALISPGSGSAGIGFSIPIDTVRFILDQYQKYGRVRLGYLGAAVQLVTQDIADSAGLPSPQGVIVVEVDPDSPASRADLRLGDIILKFRDVALNAPTTYNRVVASAPFGTALPLTLWRSGAEQTLSVTLVESAKSQAPMQPLPGAAPPGPAVELTGSTMGLTLAPITDELRARFKLAPNQNGVVVTEVAPLSLASSHGFNTGDVVLRIGDKPIASTEDLSTAVAAARQAKRPAVAVLLQQGNAVRWVGMPIVTTAN
jgi:serine protease Do